MPLVYDFDGFRLEPNERRLHFRGSPVKLTAKALAILTLLAERAPRVVSRQEFESAVWPEGFIEPANLTQTIYMLRRALGRFACLAPIETVNGCGYRLNAKVTPREVSIAFDPFRKPATSRSRLFDWRIAASLALLFALVALVGASRLAYALHPPATASSTAAGGGVKLPLQRG